MESVVAPKNWGKSGFLTVEQGIALQTFLDTCNKDYLERARYTCEHPTECALRMMRARKFDVVAACKILEDNMQKLDEGGGKEESCTASEYGEMSPEKAGDCDIGLMKTFYPHTQQGFDKMNRPILWEMDGKLDAASVTVRASITITYID